MNSFFQKKALNLKLHALSFIKAFRFTPYVLSLLLSNHSALGQCCIPDNPALRQLVETKELKTALVGVYVYDDSSKKEIADYQGDKYFVPASNTKLFSLYAGMKYLNDSIVGMSYYVVDTAILITATGDPTFLHPDYLSQPVFDFLKKTKKKIYLKNGIFPWKENPLGPGWAWDDYNDDYSVERSPFPIYGNFIRWNQQKAIHRSNPAFEETPTVWSTPEISWPVRFDNDSISKSFLVKRLSDSNVFIIHTGDEPDATQDVPFITNDLNTAASLLKDTLGKFVGVYTRPKLTGKGGWTSYPPGDFKDSFGTIYSRPVDSVFIPMMHRSDNFFAEQTLLMVSNKELGFMKTDTLISLLLADPLADLPQKPSWVDGSGLSRFNLFSPRDFVSVLIKLKNEFGMDRMKKILPTGGTGTLKNYYRSDSGYVFVKTGSLTGVLCLSGYIYTKNNHLLEFSILVNNHTGSGSPIRRAVEAYVEYLRRSN